MGIQDKLSLNNTLWTKTDRENITIVSRVSKSTIHTALRHMNIGSRRLNRYSLNQITLPTASSSKKYVPLESEPILRPFSTAPVSSSEYFSLDCKDIGNMECGTISYAQRVPLQQFNIRDVYLRDDVRDRNTSNNNMNKV